MKILLFSNYAQDIYSKNFDINKIEDNNYLSKYIELIKSNFINSRFDFNLLENKGFDVEEIYTNNKNYLKYLCFKYNIKPSDDYFRNVIDLLRIYRT